MNLPRHQRARPTFLDLFERGESETITAMDLGGHDIPNQVPDAPLRLKRVGLTRSSIPVLIDDPFGSGACVQISCTVNMRVTLDGDRRGIHVSRIGDLLARLSGKTYPSLQAYAGELNALLRPAQESQSAAVFVEGVFTYLESVHGVKQKESLEHLDLFAACEVIDGRAESSSGVGFSHITACPCVQATYRNSFAPPQSSAAGIHEKAPLLTHTQRCKTRILILDGPERLSLSELLGRIDDVVVRSQNTLPRELELLNVYRAHARPQFLEDAVRDLLVAVYRLVRDRSPEATIQVKSVSMESIHDFDMEGEIEFSVPELDRIVSAVDKNTHLVATLLEPKIHGTNGTAHVVAHASDIPQNAGEKNPGKPLQI